MKNNEQKYLLNKNLHNKIVIIFCKMFTQLIGLKFKVYVFRGNTSFIKIDISINFSMFEVIFDFLKYKRFEYKIYFILLFIDEFI